MENKYNFTLEQNIFLAKRNLVDNIYSNAIKAEELTLEDEWMKEDEWEAVYQQEEKNNGKV